MWNEYLKTKSNKPLPQKYESSFLVTCTQNWCTAPAPKSRPACPDSRHAGSMSADYCLWWSTGCHSASCSIVQTLHTAPVLLQLPCSVKKEKTMLQDNRKQKSLARSHILCNGAQWVWRADHFHLLIEEMRACFQFEGVWQPSWWRQLLYTCVCERQSTRGFK